MVGKIKRTRQKFHQGAVKFVADGEATATSVSLGQRPAPTPGAGGAKGSPLLELSRKTSVGDALHQIQKHEDAKQKVSDPFPSSVFAGTKISTEALVQTLKYDDLPSNVISVETGTEKKKQQSKKEKMKERRERWLNKIGAITRAREQQAAQARRKATPVVGDMRPLADALPELSQLVGSSRTSTHRKARVPVKKKPDPTDFSLMKPAQKRKLMETEITRFSEAVKNPTLKTNPLAAIGEQLRKKLKQEEEQS
ncbi:protein FAM207A isoform X1 [Anguilla anguilla]|uniref:protein FAM207A isoform X1 n=1 Tax=Anguilla anguilla TaxID=7936 RepID=UPI0015A8700C|nr:protein FAM207A isoform X1 [Anguilla anguilla]